MAQLTGSIETWTSFVNLTSEGTLDWANWGPETGTTLEFNSKSGGTPEISVATPINCSELAFAGDFSPLRGWIDGTPTEARSHTRSLHYFGSDVGDGYSFTVPADTTARRLKVYTGVFEGRADVTVSLSDASAGPYTVNWSGTDPAAMRVITLDFAAGSGGQTLTFQSLLGVSNGGGGVVSADAATLALVPRLDQANFQFFTGSGSVPYKV